MADAYQPALTTLVFSQDEQDAITAALTTDNPWGAKNDLITQVKAKIRNHHLLRHGQTCCYCRSILQGGGNFMIDREHILPKGTKQYRPYSYALWNLSVSCKRCNMEVKKTDVSFVVDKANVANFELSGNYLLIHPNFDEWEQYLSREVRQSNRNLLVKYTHIGDDAKGPYTYNYFKLKNLEIDSFDQGQGIQRAAADNIGPAALAVRAAAIEHGQ